MVGERIPVSDGQEASAGNGGEQGPVVKHIQMPDGQKLELTVYLDGTSSMPVHNEGTGVTQSEFYDKNQTAEIMRYAVEQQNSEQPLSPIVSLPDGGTAQIVGKNEHDIPIVHIVNPDGEVEDKLVSHQDLQHFGLPNPDAKPAEQQPAPAKTEVVVAGDEPAAEPVAVRKTAPEHGKPVTSEAEKIGKRIGFLTAKIKEADTAIDKAQREGRNEDAQNLIVERDGHNEERMALRQRERDLAAAEYSAGGKKFDLDAEIAASKARTDEMAAAMDESIKNNLDEKYPTISAEDEQQAEPIAATDEDIVASLAEAEAARARLEAADEPKEAAGTAESEPAAVDHAEPTPTVDEVAPAAAPPTSEQAPPVRVTPEVRQRKTLEEKWLEHIAKFGRLGNDSTPEQRREARTQMDAALDELAAAEAEESAESIEGQLIVLAGRLNALPKDADPLERRTLLLEIRETQLRLREIEAREKVAGKPEQEDEPSASDLERFRAEQAAIREERRRVERQEDLARVEAAFSSNPENRSVIEGLKLAQDRYTRLKAKSETRGRWGRRKREVELTEAEQSVKQAEITYARLLTDAKVAAGLLDAETPEEQRYLRGEQFFSTQRALVNGRRYNVGNYRTNKIENPKLHMKVLAGIGNFFNTGGKWSKGLKAGGIGVAAGVGTALSGVGWPIAFALSTGAGLVFRGGSVVDTLNKQVGDIGVEGRDAGIITDEMFEAFMEAYRQSTATQEAVADRFGQDALDAARQQGYLNADRARIEANTVFKRYTIGFAVGSIATVLTSSIWNATHAGASSAPVNAHPNEGTLPSDRYPTIDTHVHVPNGGGGEMATKHLLEQNGISGLKENQLLHIWQSQTHGGAADIFTQNGTGVDTYNMPGPYSGILKAGDFNFTDKVAQAMIEQAKHMPGVVIK